MSSQVSGTPRPSGDLVPTPQLIVASHQLRLLERDLPCVHDALETTEVRFSLTSDAQALLRLTPRQMVRS